MNTEEIFHKHNEDSFREIEIQDHSDGNNIIYVPNSSFSPKSGAQPDMSKDSYLNNIIPICERDIKFCSRVQM